jgi:hypothetical protein
MQYLIRGLKVAGEDGFSEDLVGGTATRRSRASSAPSSASRTTTR